MSRLRTPALAWLVVGAVLALAQYASNLLAGGEGLLGVPTARRFVAGWFQFDATEFVGIADRGYWYRVGARSPTSFFPLFPLLVRPVKALVGDTVVAATLVSAAAGLACAVLLWAWLGRWHLPARTRTLALWLLLVYPWAWFLYGVPFSDGLFVALVIASFCLVEQGRWGWAGVVGALATAARPTGLFLAPALLVLALERTEALAPRPSAEGDGWWARLRLPTVVHRRRFRPATLLTLVAFAGVGAYATYLGLRFGHPFAFVTDQSLYNGTGIETWLKAGLVDGWLHWQDPWRTFAQTVEALLALGALVAVPSVGRRLGWGYGFWVLALVAMPAIATRDFNSTGRYLLAAFPVLVVLAERLTERGKAWQVAWLGASAALLFTLNWVFARSAMVS